VRSTHRKCNLPTGARFAISRAAADFAFAWRIVKSSIFALTLP